MRPLPIAMLGLTWLGLAAVATAQTPPSILRPGAPGAPETQGLYRSLPEAIPSTGLGPGPSPPAQPPVTVHSPIPTPAPAPPFEIILHGRQACVFPRTRGLARAEGGYIDIDSPQSNILTVTLTGSTAANSYLGCTGTAAEVFQLVQEFEVRSHDPRVRNVVLTLDSALVGLLRGKLKARACVECAELSLTPLDCVNCPPIGLAHPPSCIAGTDGRLCNQHLPPLHSPPLPLGRYVLTARFVISTAASGLCDAHAVADFSPDTSQPADWVRVRDPFQGVAKKAFGFITTIAATAPPAAPGPGSAPSAAALLREPAVRQARHLTDAR